MEEESDANIAKLQQIIDEKESLIQRIVQSKSWKWTGWLRILEARFRRCLGSEQNSPPPTTPGHKLNPYSDVAVIIPCHNYGRFLQDCINSVLNQTLLPSEILVVDDGSTDETAHVAELHCQYGVKYIRCNHQHPSEARNEGANHTSASLLLFLDADDILSSDYIEKCRECMADPSIAIAYADIKYFGNDNSLFETPKFDREELMKRNYISSHALMRRQAFDLVGGYRTIPNTPNEDWDLYRRILRYHWKAQKAQAVVHYRRHDKNRLPTFNKEKLQYWQTARIKHNPITIFTPFAGRKEVLDKYIESLKNLEFDHSLIRLHCFDTSNNEEFANLLKMKLSLLDFGRITYTSAPLPKSWNNSPQSLIHNRLNSRKTQYYHDMALVYAYNNMIISCDTEYVLTLEDDIAMSSNALSMLIESVRWPETVAVVASYECHLHGYQMVWRLDKNEFLKHPTSKLSGIEKIDGAGFGCSLFRTSALASVPIYTRAYEPTPHWYDHNVFYHLRTQGEILCNWDTEVEHMKTNRSPLASRKSVTTV